MTEADENRVLKLERRLDALLQDYRLMAADVLALQALVSGLSEVVARSGADPLQVLEDLRNSSTKSRSQYDAGGDQAAISSALDFYLAAIEANLLRR